MFKLLSALSQIHASGIIHRDVKPDNFLFWTNKSCSAVDAMLIDFGLAQDAPAQDERRGAKPHVSLAALCDGSHTAALLKRIHRPRSAAEALVQAQSQSNTQRGSRQTAASKQQSKRQAHSQAPPRDSSAPLDMNGTWGGRFPPLQAVQSAVDAEFERHDKEASSSANGAPAAPQNAPRAGTASFRAPEVLLRVPYQTTGIDLWSAGVVLGSLLTRRHPFFPYEDLKTSITAVAGLLGWPRVLCAALRMGKAREARPVIQCTSRPQVPAILQPLRQQVFQNTVALLHARWPGASTDAPPSSQKGSPPSSPAAKADQHKGGARSTEGGSIPLCTPPDPHTPAFGAYNLCSEFMLCSYV